MNDIAPSPQLEDKIRAATAVPAARPEFVDRLQTDLMHRASMKGSHAFQPFHLRPAWIALLVVITLLIGSTLIIGPRRVYAAMRHLFGYIPGVGVVEQGNGIRVLAGPVSVEQSGITVTVNQVVADATRTFVAYSVVGIPAWDKSGFPICTDPPSLQLADGSTVSFLGGGEGEIGPDQPSGFATNYTFPPLPADVRQVVFLSPCQMPAIQLNLIPAPPDFVTPAVEIAATFESSGPQYTTTTPMPVPEQTFPTAPLNPSTSATPTPVPHGSGLHLDQVVELDNAYILAGNFTDAGDLPGVLAVDEMTYPMLITDANGQSISYTSRDDIHPAVELGGVWYWAYEIPKPIHGPLTLTLTSIPVHQEDSIQIPLDVGKNPQLGQKWELNRTVNLGGYDFVIDDIAKVENGYIIHFHTDTSVPDLFLGFLMAGVDSTQGGGSSNRQPQEVLYSDTINFVSLPTGHLTFLLTLDKIVQLPGTWTLIWSPPAP